MNNPLWEYALLTYSLEDVAPTCLALQDTFGLDINLLFYGAWLAHTQQRLSPDHLLEVEALVADWRDTVVKPLRALREQWPSNSRVAPLRDEVKALELRAERQQLDTMYTFYQGAAGLPRADQPLRENLILVALLPHPEGDGWKPLIEHLVTLIHS